LADVFEGAILLPDRARMWAAIARRERRTRRRFDDSPADSIICDRHAYVRVLRRDRRRARFGWGRLMRWVPATWTRRAEAAPPARPLRLSGERFPGRTSPRRST